MKAKQKKTEAVVMLSGNADQWYPDSSTFTGVSVVEDLDRDGTYRIMLYGNHSHLKEGDIVIVRLSDRRYVEDETEWPSWEVVEEE